MTLVELTNRWKNKEINDNKFCELVKNIPIFIPKDSDDEMEDGIYTRFDGNSWTDVQDECEISAKEIMHLIALAEK